MAYLFTVLLFFNNIEGKITSVIAKLQSRILENSQLRTPNFKCIQYVSSVPCCTVLNPGHPTPGKKTDVSKPTVGRIESQWRFGDCWLTQHVLYALPPPSTLARLHNRMQAGRIPKEILFGQLARTGIEPKTRENIAKDRVSTKCTQSKKV